MVKVLSMVLALVMLAALLPGCASKADSDYKYIKDKGTMIIGITQYPPMNFYDDSGKLTGFDTELAEAVCAKLGIKAEFIEINWDSKEVELNSKNIDCIWNGMCITEERKQNMSISDPYMNNEQAIVMKADREDEIMKSVDGLTLTAEAGSTGEGKVDGSIKDDGTQDVSAKEYFAKCNYVPADSMAKALMEVKSGTADMAIVDATLALYNVGPGTDFEDLVANTDINFGAQQFGIAFRKGSDMTAKVNDAIKALSNDGTVSPIAAKYGLEDALIK
ncbi:MAG: transporter substrate-binding domain-containing protein [Clostridiaceae bacterium]|nr:transporter substrate-binding domain-containing protein [Clostridiaceae bacterium]